MAEGASVNGDGWLSDESDFYGDEATRSRMTARIGSAPTVQLLAPGPRGVKRKAVNSLKQASSSTAASNVASSFDAVQFLKSRPQIDRGKTKDPATPCVNGSSEGEGEAKDDVDDSRFDGLESALQRNETVTEFLRRAPITKPSTVALGPWLWVGSRMANPLWKNRESVNSIDRFTEQGFQMLNAFTARHEKMEKENPGATPATITRKMGSFRDQLQDDLLKLAVETRVTSGKWMLFPSDEDYPRWWRVVVEATAEGKLGPTSKAATYNETDPLNLVCVYTYDFTDRDDVKRVLEELVSLGLCPQGKIIYYKCDAYTHLEIMSSNPYRLRASLYSSKEFLSHEARPKHNSIIDRVEKGNKAMDTFFAS